MTRMRRFPKRPRDDAARKWLCVVRELLRGAVRLHILHHAAEMPVHRAWMSAELTRHGYAISPGTLHRMETGRLLVSHSEVVSGRTLRVYRATAVGLDSLADGRRAVAEPAAEVLPVDEPQE